MVELLPEPEPPGTLPGTPAAAAAAEESEEEEEEDVIPGSDPKASVA